MTALTLWRREIKWSCDLQEVDPGEAGDKQAHAGLQHKRPRDDGLSGNHGHHFLFCEQTEDLRDRWGQV